MIQDRAIVTVEHELICNLSHDAISGDLEWPAIWISRSWCYSMSNSSQI